MTLVDNIAATIPWLAPIVPATIAWQHMSGILHFPWIVATLTAVVIEFLGLATITTSFQFWDWNDKKRQTDPKAPLWIVLICAGFYTAIVLIVNVLLDSAPIVQKIAKGLLSILSIIGAITIAVRSQQARRAAAVQLEKEQRKQERQEKTAEGLALFDELSAKERELLKGLTAKQIREIFPDISITTARNWAKKQ